MYTKKKLIPPIPQLKQVNYATFFKPKIFEDSTQCDDKQEHFDGWSFVNNKDDNNNSYNN